MVKQIIVFLLVINFVLRQVTLIYTYLKMTRKTLKWIKCKYRSKTDSGFKKGSQSQYSHMYVRYKHQVKYILAHIVLLSFHQYSIAQLLEFKIIFGGGGAFFIHDRRSLSSMEVCYCGLENLYIKPLAIFSKKICRLMLCDKKVWPQKIDITASAFASKIFHHHNHSSLLDWLEQRKYLTRQL